MRSANAVRRAWCKGVVLFACMALVAMPQVTSADSSDPLPSPLYQQSLKKSIDRFDDQAGVTSGKATPVQKLASDATAVAIGGGSRSKAPVQALGDPLLSIIDCFHSDGMMVIADPSGQQVQIPVDGPTRVLRDGPPYATGGTIQTEILSMDLVGESPLGPVEVRAGSDFGLPPSIGAVGGVVADPNGDFVSGFDSFFDVFTEVSIAGQRLHNEEPLRVATGEIFELPPFCHNFETQPSAPPVQLFDEAGLPTGFAVVFVLHHPVDPCPKCIYRLDCANGPADELADLGLCVGDLRADADCPNGTCATGFQTTVGNVCLTWTWTGQCEVTALPPVPGTAGGCNCDPSTATMPSSPTCPGEITCGQITCAGTGTCGGGQTCEGFPSCQGSSTCPGFYTCIGGATCAAIETCHAVTCTAEPTCAGSLSTCSGNETCDFYPTCQGTQTCETETCVGWTTCTGSQTCHLAVTCPPPPTYDGNDPLCGHPTMEGNPSCHGSATCKGFFTCEQATCAAIETCQSVTCTAEPTCAGSAATCSGNLTCPGFVSCQGTATCVTQTCIGWETCEGSSTCVGAPTCDNPPTMAGAPTCLPTQCTGLSCAGTQCPPTMACDPSCSPLGNCPTSVAAPSCVGGQCPTMFGSVSCNGGNCITVSGPSCADILCPTHSAWPTCPAGNPDCQPPTFPGSPSCGLFACPTMFAAPSCPGDPLCQPTIAPMPSCGGVQTCALVGCPPPTLPGAVTCAGAATCPATQTCNPFGVTCPGVATCAPAASCAGALTCASAATCPGNSSCSGSVSCDAAHTCSGNATCFGTATCNSLVVTCEGNPTCNLETTCGGWPTCTGTSSCDNAPTCNSALVATCSGQATCPRAPSCEDVPTCNTSPTCMFTATCDGWPTCQKPPHDVPILVGTLVSATDATATVDSFFDVFFFDVFHGPVSPLLFYTPASEPGVGLPSPGHNSFFDVFFEVDVTKLTSALAHTDTILVGESFSNTVVDSVLDLDNSTTVTIGDFLLLRYTAPPEIGGQTAWYEVTNVGAAPATANKALAQAAFLILLAEIPPSCSCPTHGDPQVDGVTNVTDVVKAVNVSFRNAVPFQDPGCPTENTDVSCDGVTSIVDVVKFVNVAFRNFSLASQFCDPCGP